MHGRPQAIAIAGHSLYLYPIFHPAAALYTPAMLTTLKEDFRRLPELLAHAAPQTARPRRRREASAPAADRARRARSRPAAGDPASRRVRRPTAPPAKPEQLGLF